MNRGAAGLWTVDYMVNIAALDQADAMAAGADHGLDHRTVPTGPLEDIGYRLLVRRDDMRARHAHTVSGKLQ